MPYDDLFQDLQNLVDEADHTRDSLADIRRELHSAMAQAIQHLGALAHELDVERESAAEALEKLEHELELEERLEHALDDAGITRSELEWLSRHREASAHIVACAELDRDSLFDAPAMDLVRFVNLHRADPRKVSDWLYKLERAANVPSTTSPPPMHTQVARIIWNSLLQEPKTLLVESDQ